MLISGMSGNEIYCLSKKGYLPGEIAVGNSVRSLGVLGGIGSSMQALAGGEIANITPEASLAIGRGGADRRMRF